MEPDVQILGRSRCVLILACLAIAIAMQDQATATVESASTPVGVSAELRDLVLPGSELTLKRVDDETAVVVRIAAVYPHGSALRYDLVYYGLEPGEFDLRDYLKRIDGSGLDDLPPIPVAIHSISAEGQVKPNPLRKGEVEGVGGYRILLIGAAAVWLVGLVAILFVGRRQSAGEKSKGASPKTLAERLRPLIERAISGSLMDQQRAELELTLVAYWRRRLKLEEEAPLSVLTTLREHAEAGPLLRSLEEWLHRPEPPENVDLEALLKPYQDLPADSLEEMTGST